MTTDPPPCAPLLEFRNVRKSYETLEVLCNACLSIAQGKSIAIVGPSGCGKSTLLNLAGTLDRPDSGQVLLDGTDLQSLSELETARIRNRRIGFVFQLHHLLPQCTVLENVLIPTLADRSARPGPEVFARAERLLDRVGLLDRKQHRPGQLSGGERQRTAVVRALINEPQLLLADEPTGALDHASAESLADLLVELNRVDGVTLLVATHSTALARRMSRALHIRNGALEPTTL